MQHPKHILVIRLSAMGDVAMTVPVLGNLEKTYPGLRITVLTRKFFLPIFQDLPNVEVFEAEINGGHKGLFGLQRLAQELRGKKIDAVADLHNVLRSNILKAFFRFYRIPVNQIDKGRAEKKALTQKNNKVFKQLKTTHQRYADVFAELGCPIELSPFQFPKKKLPSQVLQLIGSRGKKLLGIAPFAQHESKVYPLGMMKEVINRLQNTQDLQILLFGGGKEESEFLGEWESEFENTINIARKVSFEEELALISNLDVMLSMDSGNGHLAANYGVSVISLWGLTHPYAGFAPFGQPKEYSLFPKLQEYPQIPTSIYGTKVPPGYEGAMKSIPVESVVEKVREVLFRSM